MVARFVSFRADVVIHFGRWEVGLCVGLCLVIHLCLPCTGDCFRFRPQVFCVVVALLTLGGASAQGLVLRQDWSSRVMAQSSLRHVVSLRLCCLYTCCALDTCVRVSVLRCCLSFNTRHCFLACLAVVCCPGRGD